jgi:hypothetical protein
VRIVSIAPRRAVVAGIARAIAARLKRPLLRPAISRRTRGERPVATGTIAGGTIVAIALEALGCPIIAKIAARGVVIAAARRAAFAVDAIWPLVAAALALKILASRPALAKFLGEFLLGPPGTAGAALATSRPITPAAGIIVFIVVAGHEGSH